MLDYLARNIFNVYIRRKAIIKYTDFSSKGKNIHLHFSEHECYFKKCGRCLISEQVKWDTTMPVPEFRCEEFYCPYILYQIETDGFKVDSRHDKIVIKYNEASNLYEVYEGRHRVCISQKTDICIWAYIEE